MAKINDTTTYPSTTPATDDLLIGTDVSDTGNDANGETVNFSVANILGANGQLGNRNKLINGGFQVAQRGTSFSGGTANADDTYTLDRWYVLSEGSDSVDVSQDTSNAPDTGGYCAALAVATTGQKFGIAQIIEGVNCGNLIGNEVTLSFDAKVSNARIDTVKAAIVAWSGTADSVTSDIISTWNADGTTPTLIANATFENTPSDLGVTTSWVRYEITATVDTASAENIVVFIWSDDATNPLAADTLYLANVQIEYGSATPFEYRNITDELLHCRRYYWRIQGSASDESAVGSGYLASSAEARTYVKFPVEMRAIPTASTSSGVPFDISHTGGAFYATLLDVIDTHTVGGFVRVSRDSGSVGTAGQGCLIRLENSASHYLAFSAEL